MVVEPREPGSAGLEAMRMVLRTRRSLHSRPLHRDVSATIREQRYAPPVSMGRPFADWPCPGARPEES